MIFLNGIYGTEKYVLVISVFPPPPQEKGLDHLCEYIEDCEHTNLAVHILHLLGRKGPHTKKLSIFIRYSGQDREKEVIFVYYV